MSLNPFTGSQAVPRRLTERQTHRHDEANSRFSQFYECT